MPYITKDQRSVIESNCHLVQLFEGLKRIIPNAGDINYIISNILKEYIDIHGLSYANVNELVGVLECAKLELYRRIASPYEDKKIKINGDVY